MKTKTKEVCLFDDLLSYHEDLKVGKRVGCKGEKRGVYRITRIEEKLEKIGRGILPVKSVYAVRLSAMPAHNKPKTIFTL